MAEALAQVKRDLGRDAVILHTRTLRKGGVLGVGSKTLVEITASRDARLLHPAEQRAMIGRNAPRSRSDMGSRSRPSRAEGAAMTRPAGVTREPAASNDLSAFTSDLKGEMGELRAMVRELLQRSPESTSASAKTPDVPAELRGYYARLIQNEVADELAREVLAQAKARLEEGGDGSAAGRGLGQIVPTVMAETIERMLPPMEPVQLDAAATKYVALVGPTGVGKTTTIAKLAAHFKLRENKRVGLITIDTYRIAAVDQLKVYADILDVPLETVLTPEEMGEAMDRLKDADLVLIDTSGRSQRDADRLDELKVFLDAVRQAASVPDGTGRRRSKKGRKATRGPDGRFRRGRRAERTRAGLEVHLVLSCTSHPTQLLQVAKGFGPLGLDRVVFTKLDEAVGFGTIFNVIRRLNLQLSYLTTGQDVPDDLEVGHRRRLAELILNGGEEDNSAGPGDVRPAASVDHVA